MEGEKKSRELDHAPNAKVAPPPPPPKAGGPPKAAETEERKEEAENSGVD